MNRMRVILEKADMEIPRTPQELCNWVESKIAVFSTTKEGKRYARSGDFLPKKLREEIRPFGLFAMHHYGPREDIKCTPNLTNENYDARIDFDDASTPPTYVEITYAKDGYDESLRLEVLNEKGSVNALGKILTSGTKASGRRNIEVKNEMVNENVIRRDGLNILRKRIVNKSGKAYGPNHVLVIVIDDYLVFRTEEEQGILEEYAKSVIGSVELDFREVFLLGSSGKYLSSVYKGIGSSGNRVGR